MMPGDLPERIWEIFSHGGDFEAEESEEDEHPGWKVIGIYEIPLNVLAVLESPLYAPYVLEAVEAEKALNREADDLHGKLYGNDYYPESMKYQLLKRYQDINGKKRMANLCPYTKPLRRSFG